MSDILLAKQELEPGGVDLAVGEAHLVRKNLFELFPFDHFEIPPCLSTWEYPYPYGIKKLVNLLEYKHGYPVVITNGAKQALAASFYAMRVTGHHTINMRRPYWCLLPPLIEALGLKWTTAYTPGYPQLLVLPNNPDNYLPSIEALRAMEESYKEDGCPIIHDAAYYTGSYIPCGFNNYKNYAIGDLQIYSMSKAFGLSGIRLGYVVCKNEDYYKHICEYMEMMTVGVSTLSQEYMYSLLSKINECPNTFKKFEDNCYSDLYDAKRLLKRIKSDIISVPSNMEDMPGMFAFVKLNNKDAFTKAKIKVIDGKLFGAPGYIRINLGVDYKILKECVERLNDILL